MVKLLEPIMPVVESFEDLKNLSRARGYKERGIKLKKNQIGNLRKKIRKACPRCNKGTLKKTGKHELKCNNNDCKFSKYWSPTWANYG
jgi:tRNA(Ile2) C34 agmatinyltransferase TiaS